MDISMNIFRMYGYTISLFVIIGLLGLLVNLRIIDESRGYEIAVFSGALLLILLETRNISKK